MISYTIKLAEVADQTLNTDVEYTYSDGVVELVRVSHFRPSSKDEVLANIEARGESEQAKHLATLTNEDIKEELDALIAGLA